MENLVKALGRVSHFRGMAETDLRLIVNTGRVRHISHNSVIFVEGDPCAGLFVLLTGRVHLCKLGPQGQELILAVIEPVIMFNEVAALDSGPNPVTALAVEDCQVWQVGATDFQSLLLKYPQMALGLLRVLAARNRMLVSRYEDLSFRTVLARSAKLLLDLSQYGRQPIDRRKHPNRELAARIATVPEAFSRSLNIFRKREYILTTRLSITVQEPDTLSRLAQIGPALPQS